MGELLAYNNAAPIWRGAKIALKTTQDTVAPTSYVTITEDELVEEPIITPKGWEEAWNETRVTFRDRAFDLNEDAEPFADAANQEIIGRPRQKTFNRMFVTKRSVAAKLAQIIGRQAGMPLASVRLKLKSTVAGLEPGGVINLVYPKKGMTKYRDWEEKQKETSKKEPIS